MHEKGVDSGVGLELAKRECRDRKVEAVLPWLPDWGMFSEGTRYQRL